MMKKSKSGECTRFTARKNRFAIDTQKTGFGINFKLNTTKPQPKPLFINLWALMEGGMVKPVHVLIALLKGKERQR